MSDLVEPVVANEPTFSDVAEALALGLPYRLRVGADGGEARFLQIGAACRATLGVEADAVLADPRAFVQLILPEDCVRLKVAAEAAIAARRPAACEIRMLRPDGELRWLRVSGAPNPSADGAQEWLGLVTDITESKRLGEQVADQRRRLELAVELTEIGLFEWDRDDPHVMRWSEHQYAIYGVPPHTPMTVKAFRDLIHPEDRPLAYMERRWAAEAPDEGDRSGEYRIVRPGGEVRWVLSHQRVRRDALGVKSVYGTTIDITERRNAEERGRLQMRELAHRAKNAMAVMMAMVQQASRGASSVEELTDVLMARLDAMAKSQELAAASEGGPLPLPTLFRRALDAFDISRFDLDPALETETIPGDAVIPMALLLNELATNAVKYGALSSGEGRVRLSRAAAAEGRIALEWRENGGPLVAPPARQGFGMRLLGAALSGVGGGVEPRFAAEGFIARVEMAAPPTHL